ncbi:MAG: hypothetical protein ACREX0_16320, partial [Noviherbaspirillum sp.]
LDAHTGMRLAALYQKGIRVIAALMLPLCAFAAAGAYDGLRLWLGESFASNGHRVVEIVALGIFVYAISHLPFAWLQAVGRSHLTAKVHLFELPLYAAGLYAGVTRWGIIGAASMWTLRVLLDCLLMLRLAGRESSKPAAVHLLMGLSFIAVVGALSGPEHGWPWRAGLCIAAPVFGFAIAWFGLLHREDRADARKMRGLR